MSRSADREANFTYLLLGLLFVLLAGPIANEFRGAPTPFLTSAAFSATMLIGVWSLLESRRVFWLGIGLVACAWGASALQYVAASQTAELLSLCATLAFCALSAAFATMHMFRPGGITPNRLAGAVCVYLLIGIAIGLLNIMLARFLPGSFNGLGKAAPDSELIYYSFVTMSTLGFGDITPARPLARGLAYMAAIAGQFYIAMLVSALVSMYLAHRPSGQR